MAIFASSCPHCRERIPIDDSRDNVFCMYCGVSLKVADFSEGIDGFINSSATSAPSPSVSSKEITVRGSTANATVTLYIDGKALCKVKKQELVTLDITPGKHVLWVRSGFEGAQKREFDLSAGDYLEIVHNGFKGYDIIKL